MKYLPLWKAKQLQSYFMEDDLVGLLYEIDYFLEYKLSECKSSEYVKNNRN